MEYLENLGISAGLTFFILLILVTLHIFALAYPIATFVSIGLFMFFLILGIQTHG